MFSNEGLGGGGQRAHRSGSMAGTVGREVPHYFSQKTGMGHLLLVFPTYLVAPAVVCVPTVVSSPTVLALVLKKTNILTVGLLDYTIRCVILSFRIE
jgi:hypothetical protein